MTLVVYFGADEWDAPKSLHEMLECRDEKVLSFVTDYRLNLIAPAQMSEEEIGHFTTSFREVMLLSSIRQISADLVSWWKRTVLFVK